MATAHASAPDAAGNTTISPSPRFLTSVPPVAASASRSTPKCVRRRSSKASWDNWDANAVEPTRSVNITVTVSIAAGEVS